MQRRLSIIIPAFNEESLLPDTLESVRRSLEALDLPCSRAEVIVVDNNSSDRTAEIARRGGATVVFEPVNQIARARNAGGRVATGDDLVFLDADTLLTPELLARAIKLLASGRICGGGAVIEPDRPFPPSLQKFVRLWNWISVKRRLAAGSFFFCLGEAFREIGGFDQGVYAGEEIWFSMRVKRWGRRRGLSFKVIEHPPVVTSSRKAEWFSIRALSLQMLVLFFFPFATRWRRCCWLWYRRPKSSSTPSFNQSAEL